MDDRRWSSQQVIDGGILGLPMPKGRLPDDAVLADVDEEKISAERFRAGLQAGGLHALMYYGSWAIWRTEEGFDGQLMQYRKITEDFAGVPLDVALEKALEWAYGCYG